MSHQSTTSHRTDLQRAILVVLEQGATTSVEVRRRLRGAPRPVEVYWALRALERAGAVRRASVWRGRERWSLVG